MSATLAPEYAAPASFSTSAKAHAKPKPVNVFSDDGSFLERFQRSKQEEIDQRKAEDALAKKKQFADRFKTRGKRAPPLDSSHAVMSTDDTGPNKKPRLANGPQHSEYQEHARN